MKPSTANGRGLPLSWQPPFGGCARKAPHSVGYTNRVLRSGCEDSTRSQPSKVGVSTGCEKAPDATQERYPNCRSHPPSLGELVKPRLPSHPHGKGAFPSGRSVHRRRRGEDEVRIAQVRGHQRRLDLPVLLGGLSPSRPP